LRNHGHRIILMGDELDRQSEEMVGKFDRLLRSSTDVVIYWPTKAKMSTTYTEMVLLRKAGEEGPLPRLWFLHHENVATIERGVFKVHEPGARSRYLTSLAVLGIRPIPWRTTEDLRERTALLAADVALCLHLERLNAARMVCNLRRRSSASFALTPSRVANSNSSMASRASLSAFASRTSSFSDN